MIYDSDDNDWIAERVAEMRRDDPQGRNSTNDLERTATRELLQQRLDDLPLSVGQPLERVLRLMAALL